MEHEYGHVDSARALVKASGDAIACEHEIAGEMGFRTIHQVDAKAQMVLRVACAGLPVRARERASGAAADDAASDDEADELMAEERAAAAAAGDASAAKNSSAAMARIATELEGLSTDGAQVLTAPRLVSQDAPPTLPAAVQAIILAAAVTVRKSQADDGTRSWSVARTTRLCRRSVDPGPCFARRRRCSRRGTSASARELASARCSRWRIW